jgi:hypothetical protein
MFIWAEPILPLLLQRYEINETYKTHNKTLLKEGLQCTVCNNIKSLAAFPPGRFFIYRLK